MIFLVLSLYFVLPCLPSVDSFNTAPQSRSIANRHFREHESRQSVISKTASLIDHNIDITQKQDEKPLEQVNIVLVTGFESFNRDLYKEAGKLLPRELDVNLRGMSSTILM